MEKNSLKNLFLFVRLEFTEVVNDDKLLAFYTTKDSKYVINGNCLFFPSIWSHFREKYVFFL